MRIAARREVYADTTSAPDGSGSVGNLQQQAGAIFDGAAVSVGTFIDAILQKLVNQIAVGSVNFHTVKTRFFGVLRALPEGFDNGGNFLSRQRSRRNEGFHGAQQADVTFRRDGAGRDRQFAVQIHRIGNAPDVPKLRDDAPARLTHGVCHLFPAHDLFRVPESGYIGIADALRRHWHTFGNDQTGIGARLVILRHQSVGHMSGVGATTGHRRHDDTIGKPEFSGLQRVEQGGHEKLLLKGQPRCPLLVQYLCIQQRLL